LISTSSIARSLSCFASTGNGKESIVQRAAVIFAVMGMSAVLPAAAGSDPPRDFAVGSAVNTFTPAGGPNHVSGAAHSDSLGADPTGHIRARGDLDGEGPLEPFTFEGEVTCLRVEGNRAAIKYRFKHATGSGAPLEGGGVQIFAEDNGEPRRGQAVDAGAFDPPEPAGVFDAAGRDRMCSDPRLRQDYDPIDSGNLTVRDAQP
jgi:hypothetical protein